jgi:hypothetical protein
MVFLALSELCLPEQQELKNTTKWAKDTNNLLTAKVTREAKRCTGRRAAFPELKDGCTMCIPSL